MFMLETAPHSALPTARSLALSLDHMQLTLTLDRLGQISDNYRINTTLLSYFFVFTTQQKPSFVNDLYERVSK